MPVDLASHLQEKTQDTDRTAGPNLVEPSHHQQRRNSSSKERERERERNTLAYNHVFTSYTYSKCCRGGKQSATWQSSSDQTPCFFLDQKHEGTYTTFRPRKNIVDKYSRLLNAKSLIRATSYMYRRCPSIRVTTVTQIMHVQDHQQRSVDTHTSGACGSAALPAPAPPTPQVQPRSPV
jgi:hypothetical protein